MTLIKSISGIRGTIGGKPGDGLSPLDVVKFTAAYAKWLKSVSATIRQKVVVGRDARISGEMVNALVCATLSGMGIDVVNLGLATTPTTEIAVTAEQADGGIILTASHNPKQWNALKLLNAKGEFISAADGAAILKYAEEESFEFAEVDDLGKMVEKDYTAEHVRQVLELNLVDVEAVQKANFAVAFDAVNSVGGIAIPALLEAMGVKNIVPINDEATGQFAHVPEPLPENLVDTCRIVKEQKVDVCFVVDPDVDRLSIISEDGSMFNEEYTLVAVADYILSKTPGNTVSNMSSSRALRVITEKYGCSYAAAAVGEVNVVSKMRETNAIIGGEGNGGVIYPASHNGRDALVGIALFLTQLAKSGLTCSELRKTFPDYFISKNKIELTPEINVDKVLEKIEALYTNEQVSTIDGVKIDFADEWVHLRKSNTEPIIRIYAESTSPEKADELAKKLIKDIQNQL
ncbi:phosphoglucosamine mutase [Mangrovibacterium lignilyticum]|uniref:phosphoglucosamine mutase n=1 Tax=Mangrovibacterium lignilyticum TaxID=2668052 RepID=UPI0013CF8E1C|nr:phosphoglucosamine mutase [Mangrovibacterium lignilyticum]